jgi:hypothetical protein
MGVAVGPRVGQLGLGAGSVVTAQLAAVALAACQPSPSELPAGTPASDAGALEKVTLDDLRVSRGTLEPPFDPDITDYTLELPLDADTLTVTPSVAREDVAITAGGTLVQSGESSHDLVLDLGNNLIHVAVRPEVGDGQTYLINARRCARMLDQLYIKASNTEANDRFGVSIALHGDTLVVAAPYEDSSATGIGGDHRDNGAPDSGAVYVFARSGDTWSQQAYIKASDTRAGDRFGFSVALFGDTLAVSRLHESDEIPPTISGAVYVFSRAGNQWSQQAYLEASGEDLHDLFGFSVALFEDTLAIGALVGDSAAPDAGLVYIFSRSGSQWTEEARVSASNAELGDYFGRSVALSRDTLVVGAPGEDSSATGVDGDQDDNIRDYSGAAYVFTRTGSDWTQQAYLKASNTGQIDAFGHSVALSGDTVAVGAYGEDSGSTGVDGDQGDGAYSAGSVYVFTREGITWSQQAYVKASNTDAHDYFGRRVALSGDRLAVAAYYEDSGALGVGGDEDDNSAGQAGAAYLFGRADGQWSQQAYLKASNTERGDAFGGTLALDGEVLAVGAVFEDGGATGVAGQQHACGQEDNGAPSAGAVYLFP